MKERAVMGITQDKENGISFFKDRADRLKDFPESPGWLILSEPFKGCCIAVSAKKPGERDGD